LQVQEYLDAGNLEDPDKIKSNGLALLAIALMNADLYVHFGKRRFHRVESFDHFMLFATDSVEKPKIPKGNPVSDSTGNPGPAGNR
jgi:hypothetical protein